MDKSITTDKLEELASLKKMAEESGDEYLADYYDEKIHILKEIADSEKI